MLLLFLPLFMGLVPVIHGLCISLNTSLFCRGFGSFAVDPSLIPWLGNQSIITSAQDLDQHVTAAVVSPTWWDNSFHCTSTAASIVSAPLMASTIVCSQMIGMSAAQCNMLAANSSRLCPDTCSAITTALAGSMCSVQQPNPLCNTTIPAANTTCIHAYQNQAQCTGNFTQDQWCHYCQSAGNYADPCCGQQASTCATRGLSTVAIVAIAIVGTLGLLILAGCAWHCLAPRLNTRQNEPNSSFSSTLQKTTRKWWPFAKTNDRYHTLSPDTSPLLKAQQQLVRNSDAKVAAATINPFAASSIGAMSHTTRAASATSVISADAPPLKYTLTSAVRDDPCFYEAIYVNKADWAVDLTLAKDDLIYVFCYTNEDWAIGYNLHTGMQGYFPLICIRSIPMAAVWTKVQEEPRLADAVHFFLSQHHDSEPLPLPSRSTTLMGPPSSDDDEWPLTPPLPTLKRQLTSPNNRVVRSASMLLLSSWAPHHLTSPLATARLKSSSSPSPTSSEHIPLQPRVAQSPSPPHPPPMPPFHAT